MVYEVTYKFNDKVEDKVFYIEQPEPKFAVLETINLVESGMIYNISVLKVPLAEIIH